MQVNLRSFKQKVRHNTKQLKSFLTRIGKHNSKGWDQNAVKLSAEVWNEVDCLSCANCCKNMTPTFTNVDIKRISTFLKTTPKAFKEQWLSFDKKDNDWMNTSQPCQFLNLKTNMCNIYEVRPADCAGFPHFNKKKVVDYMHVHKQNISYCPATYKMVEKMQNILN